MDLAYWLRHKADKLEVLGSIPPLSRKLLFEISLNFQPEIDQICHAIHVMIPWHLELIVLNERLKD